MSRKIDFFATENEDEIDVGIGAPSDEEIIDNVTEVEEESEKHLDNLDDAEVGIQKVEQVEEITDTLDESIEKGEGLDETGAEILEVAIESIFGKNTKRIKKIMPAMESFGSSNSRVAATKLASEELKFAIEGKLEEIKDWLIKQWEKIKAFFAKTFKTANGINLLAKKKLEEIKDIKGKTTNKVINLKSVAEAFTVEGIVSVTDIKKIVEHQIKISEELVSGLQEVFSDILSLVKKDPEELSKGIEEAYKKNIAKYFTNSVISGLVEGKKIKFENDSIDIVTTDLSKVKTEVEILSLKDIETVLELVGSTYTAYDKLQKNVKEIESVIKNLDKSISEIKKAENGKVKGTIINLFTKNVSKGMINYNKVISILNNILIKTEKELYTYATASIKEYKEE